MTRSTPDRRRLAPLAAAATLLAAALLVPGPGRAAQPELVVDGLFSPVYVTSPPGEDRLFIVQRFGTIQLYDDGLVGTVLDLFDQLEFGSEAGLLGMVFSPDYASDGTFYVYYTATSQTAASQSRVSAFQMMGDPATATVADPMSEDVLFALDQPDNNHNGGSIHIRDGYLYLALGDGMDDDGLMRGDIAQDDGSPFGKMVRFDLSQQDPQPEIWAKGLRNPYRWSFDRETGDVYIGDVGQASREEINVESGLSGGGLNYGWNVEEGSLCNDPDGVEPPCGSLELVRPVVEYDHSGGNCSVTGGVVYRGQALPEEQGSYFFGDWCSGRIWSFVWDGAGGTVGPVRDRTEEIAPDVDSPFPGPYGFGEDGFGEMYIVVDGAVYRVPEPGAAAGGAAALLALAAAGRRRAPAAGRARSC